MATLEGALKLLVENMKFLSAMDRRQGWREGLVSA